jgi:hypothetical protein
MALEICRNSHTFMYSLSAQGDIVGREYIKVCEFLGPYGISLRDSTIKVTVFATETKILYINFRRQPPFDGKGAICIWILH